MTPIKSNQKFLLDINNMQLFALLRYLHLYANLKKNIGEETKLSEHNLRFGQLAKLSFQEKQLYQIIQNDDFLKIKIQGFGMLGANGALPLHLSEAIYEKNLHEKDYTFNDFLDIFHHRLIGLFYRAWLSSEPAVMLDNKNNTTSFDNHIIGFIGNQSLSKENKKDLSKFSQLYYSSLLLNQNMPVHNLIEILHGYFDVPIRIQENIGEWIDARMYTTKLSVHQSDILGSGLLIGTHYFDATQKFRIIIGPVDIIKYLGFLKNGYLFNQLKQWIIRYIKYSYQFDIKIIINKNDIEPCCLNASYALGRTSWLGHPKNNPSVIIESD